MTGDARALWDALGPDIDALLDLAPAQRETHIEGIAATDPARADALRRWLASIDASEGLLEPPVPEPPTGTGPWRAVTRIGAGGMGEVWRGERADGAFQRDVAIKFLRDDRSGVASSIARERALLARLRHPGIAQLLDGGVTPNGRPWLVTEWVDGQRLDQWLAGSRPDLRTRIGLIQRLAEAVAAAHGNLVVHRDLKPANVMVDAQGAPRLLDFGIARLLDDASGAAATRDQAMTPAWAAPEQLRGEPVDTRTDVYGLGGLLYFALCDRGAHDLETASLAEVVEQVCHGEVPPPSSVARVPGVDADLDAISLCALAREPRDRYASAAALADDLARWLDGREVAARRPGRLERLARLARRHRLVTALAASLLVALVAGSVATAWQAHRAAQARDAAVAERDAALRESTRSERLVDTFARLFREADGDERLSASQWLDRAATLGPAIGPADPGAEAEFLGRVAAIEQDRGQHARAAAVLARVVAAPPEQVAPDVRAEALCRLATARNMTGDAAGALVAFDEGTRLAESLQGMQRTVLADCLNSRANVALYNGHVEDAERNAARRALEVLDAIAADSRVDLRWRLAGVLYTLAAIHDIAGEDADAAARYAEVLAIDRALGNTDSSDHAALLTALAGSLMRAGHWEDADARFGEGIAIYERVSGRHPNLASDLTNRAQLKNQLGQWPEAQALAERALEMQRALGGGNTVAVANARFALGIALREQGQPDAAIDAFDAAIAGYAGSSTDPRRVARVQAARALAVARAGRLDEARDTIDAVVEQLRDRADGTLGEALQTRARIRLATGDRAAAQADALDAQRLIDARLPEGHPLRARAATLVADTSTPPP
jgi:tetratricopeptide (TPR) repeat protein